jgi:OOP family OmpA-OmpF porin
MAQTIKPGAKIGLALLLVAAIFFLFKYTHIADKFLPKSKSVATLDKVDLPAEIGVSSTVKEVTALAAPSTEAANTSKPYVTWNQWEWNSQVGTHFANGGPQTTKGSLMEAFGVNLRIQRADDHYKETIPKMVECAKALQLDKHTTTGVQFVSIMGDGAAVFIDALNKALGTISPDLHAEILFSPGRSYGEDQAMGDAAWKADPQKALGAVFATVIKDGDWNILMKWAGDNNLPVNLNENEWHNDAINVINSSDYLDAAKKYNSNYKVTLKEFVNGRSTGQNVEKEVNGVATWTPGDVMVAEGKGGLVTLASTKDYGAQMANTVIGINKWDAANADIVRGIIGASLAGSDQIKANPKALDAAAAISAKIYGDQDGPYWAKYYKGLTKNDSKGTEVSLGGSKVMNLQDNLDYFGITQGRTNTYKAVYTTFGNLVHKLYPEDFKALPDFDQSVNLSYLQAVASNTKTIAPAEHKTFSADADIIRDADKVANKNYNIEFETGSANFTSAAKEQLADIANDLLVSSELRLEIDGHTDNTGNFAANKQLSLLRAQAVKSYLQSMSPADFTDARVVVKAYGSAMPIASNATPAGQAKNRRVTIIQAR